MKKLLNSVSDIVRERFLSPMYSYFIIAWIITNRKFVYSFLFVEQSDLSKLKIDYLISFYPTDTVWHVIGNILDIFIIPAIFAFIAVWWLTQLSEIFYEKYEQFKINKRVIKNKLLYTEKVNYAREQRRIRDAKSDENEIKYIDNKEFNDWYDNGKENIIIGEYEFLPSETLYYNDYEAYKEELDSYIAEEHLPF